MSLKPELFAEIFNTLSLKIYNSGWEKLENIPLANLCDYSLEMKEFEGGRSFIEKLIIYFGEKGECSEERVIMFYPNDKNEIIQNRLFLLRYFIYVVRYHQLSNKELLKMNLVSLVKLLDFPETTASYGIEADVRLIRDDLFEYMGLELETEKLNMKTSANLFLLEAILRKMEGEFGDWTTVSTLPKN
jgi:hypothetical protein